MTLTSIFFLNNLVGFFILYRVFSSFFNQKLPLFKLFILIGVFTVLKTCVNLLEFPFLNIILTIIVITIFCFQFKGLLKVKIFLTLLFLSVGIVAEPFGVVAYRALEYVWVEPFPFMFGLIVILLVRAISMEVIIVRRNINIKHLSFQVLSYLYSVAILSIMSSLIFMVILWENGTALEYAMCTVFSVLVLLINFFLFKFVDKYATAMENFQQGIILAKTFQLRDEYYQQLEKSNTKIREIKHDLRNRLLTLNDVIDNESAKKQLRTIVGEIEVADSSLYTTNPTLNSLLQKKIAETVNDGIGVETHIDVPKELVLNPEDMGILLGNLLDNAMEASCQLKVEKRKIQIKIYHDHEHLFVEIVNNKKLGDNPELKSTKKDAENHGIGLKSVKRIVKKYKGNIKFENLENEFKVVLIINIKMK